MRVKKVVLGSLLSSAAFGAGYEQLLMWSGKNAGEASAVTSTVSGSESIYFNPAGLVTGNADAPKNDLSINAGYIRSQFKAPIATPDSQYASKYGNSTIAAVTYSRQLNDKWAVGLGVFPSAGIAVDYSNIALGGPLNFEPKVDLRLYEISAGVAYKPAPHWTIGAAYRVTYTTANFSAITSQPALDQFRNLSGWDYLSFRVGAKYTQDKWGAGLNVRTPVNVVVKGKQSLYAGAASAEQDGAQIKTTFPLAVSLAGHYKVTEKLTLALDYTLLDYHAANKLTITGPAGGPPEVPLNWKSGHVFRLGGDYALGQKTHLRAGYILVTQITSKDTMIPTYEAPGIGHLFTLGGGYAVTDAIDANLAVFYGMATGHGDQVTNQSTGGSYDVAGLGVHAGLGWKF